MADIWVPLRAGVTFYFWAGLSLRLAEQKEFRDYVRTITNASTLLRDDFRDTERPRWAVLGLGCGE